MRADFSRGLDVVPQTNLLLDSLLVWRGRAGLALGKSQDALADLQRAAGLKFTPSGDSLSLGECLLALGRLDEADAVLTRAVDVQDRLYEALAWRAVVRARRQKFADAVTDMAAAQSQSQRQLGPFGQANPVGAYLEAMLQAVDQGKCGLALLLSDQIKTRHQASYQIAVRCRDPQKRREYLVRAANEGDADAAAELGQAYLHGNGVARDVKQAAAWYARAAAVDRARFARYADAFVACANIAPGWSEIRNDFQPDSAFAQAVRQIADQQQQEARQVVQTAARNQPANPGK